MILVDGAVWPWRGRRWAHLISDHSLDELHAFAHLLGKRRVGFQGDHYDVDEAERAHALGLGAVAIDSRVLVRRLREAGLRRRDRIEPWTVQHDGPLERPLADVIRSSTSHPGLRSVLAAAAELLPIAPDQPVVLLERSSEAATIVPLTSALEEGIAAFPAVSEVWLHQPRREREDVTPPHTALVAELIARLDDPGTGPIIRSLPGPS